MRFEPVIARDLADARIEALSANRWFATAYNAALQSASMVIACAAYRVTAKTGHHRVTIDAVTLAVGSAAKPFADYLETCRRKRNVIDYTRAHVAGDSEATEIVKMARRLRPTCGELDRVDVREAETPAGRH